MLDSDTTHNTPKVTSLTCLTTKDLLHPSLKEKEEAVSDEEPNSYAIDVKYPEFFKFTWSLAMPKCYAPLSCNLQA